MEEKEKERLKKIYQEMSDEKILKEVFKRNEYKKEAFELLLEEARKRIIEDEEERRKIFGEEELNMGIKKSQKESL